METRGSRTSRSAKDTSLVSSASNSLRKMKYAEFNEHLKQLEEKGMINLGTKACDPNTKRVYEK